MSDDQPQFSSYGPLPHGRVAIEASAGTGKTFTLATLATRYLAEEDIGPSELLIVTFTRAATAELRSRIRGQLIEAAAELRPGAEPTTELTRLLASTDREERSRRLDRAVTDFDSVSISTIHGFATQVRRTLGLTSAVDPDARLMAEGGDLILAACADSLAAASALPVPSEVFPSMDSFREAVSKKVGGTDLRLLPDAGCGDVDPEFLFARDLVVDAVGRLAVRRRDERTIGFDDVLVQLRAALSSDGAAAVVAALRSRYKVVLIDEFQDTDRVQWEVFSTLFGNPGDGSTLVLVGDPKQAIYRFRGADISVYLDVMSSGTLTARHTLTTNWRADGACIDAMHALLDGTTYGDPSIRYLPVRASEENLGRRMVDRSGTPCSGMELRLAPKSTLPTKPAGGVDGERTNRLIERDLAARVRELLETARIPTSRDDPTLRDLVPSDVAVLVTAWDQAHELQRALAREGVPAVVAGTGSVLDSPAAQQFRFLLDAMDRPGDLRRIRAYALSWFEGWSVERVARADDRELAELQDRLTEWVGRLATHPVVEVFAQVWRESGVVERTLGLPDGDRNVTDLDHVAEVLHATAPQGHSGVAGLLAALDAPPGGQLDADVDADVVARRVESEGEAVLLTTVWRAKGLQYPVVCLPMLWRKSGTRRSLIYTDPTTGERMLDVTLNKPWPDQAGLDQRKALASKEEAAERLRILYVALTRAQHLTAVWWAGNSPSTTALTRLLFARNPDGSVRADVLDPVGTKVPTLRAPADPFAALGPLVEASDGALRLATVARRPNPSTGWTSSSTKSSRDELTSASFERLLERNSSRWSFTSITRYADGESRDPFDTSVADAGAADEGLPEPGGATGADQMNDGASDGLLGDLVAGAAFGTFVHAVLEEVDFTSSSLESDLEEAAGGRAGRLGIDVARLATGRPDGLRLLVDGLARAIRTPLGPLCDDRPLSSISRGDRIDELAFDLRIRGSSGRPSAADFGRLLLHHVGIDHPFGPWAEALAEGAISARLDGHLTGSIDLVARIGQGGGERFVIADYKTNRLTRHGRRQQVGDYAQDRMVDAMCEHDYPLQAMVYAAALHRYLRWRRPDDGRMTSVHGAAYLFVRGMNGPGGPVDGEGVPDGVVSWSLPQELVADLSDLLDGRLPQGVR